MADPLTPQEARIPAAVARSLAREGSWLWEIAHDAATTGLLRGLATYRPGVGKRSSWLYHLARQDAGACLKRTIHRKRQLQIQPAGNLLAIQPDPGNHILAVEQAEYAHHLLATLPDRWRLCLWLWCQGWTGEEIGSVLGVHQATISALVRRAIHRLRRKAVR